MPVPGSVIEHVRQIAGAASRVAVDRRVGVRAVRGARTLAGRDGAAGSDTSKPRLRKMATAWPMPPLNSSDVASRPVAKRCATPRTALES